jgi:purine-binding chemotaxis protein CheW
LIALPGEIALLPGADRVVLGSIAHRGGLLPLLSLRSLLQLDGRGEATTPRVVVARIKGARVGLAVDALDAILRVSEAAIDPLPLVLSRGSAEAKIQAIVRRDDGRTLVSVLATDHLLNEAIMTRLQDDGGQAARAVPALPDAVEQFLVFRLGEEEFGLPVAAVREVVAMPATLTRLPRAPAFVAGLMNLRGRVVPVIDQRRRFAVPGEPTTRRRVIVAALDELEAGFVVDGVSEVLRVPTSQLTAAPAMGEGTRVFDRVASVAGGRRTVLVIEPRELLDRAERDLLAAMRDREAAAES